MSKLALAAAMLLAAVPLAAAPLVAAHAEPMGGAEIRARSTGGEFRGYGSTPRAPLEDMIWRLHPDGGVAAISQVRRQYGQGGGYFEEYGDAGTWRVEGDRLCVEFHAALRYASGCYAVDGIGGDHVRLAGPVQLQGTLGR